MHSQLVQPTSLIGQAEVLSSGHWGMGYSLMLLQFVVANGLFVCTVPEYRKSCNYK